MKLCKRAVNALIADIIVTEKEIKIGSNYRRVSRNTAPRAVHRAEIQLKHPDDSAWGLTRVGIVGGWGVKPLPSSCLQTLIFE